MTDVASLRWKLFCRIQAEGEKLPPTKGALHQKIISAHYQAMIWDADVVPISDLPPQQTIVGPWRVAATGQFQLQNPLHLVL